MVSAKILYNTSSDITLDNTLYESLKKKIPGLVNKVLAFELEDANRALGNAIRRTLTSEIPVKHLTVSLTDIVTTDPYVIRDAIRKRIEMIPIAQSINPDSVFAIRFENNTETYIDVSRSNIKLNGVVVSKDIMPDIPVCDINSGTSFTVNDICVVESCGYDNARASIGRVAYKTTKGEDPTCFRLEIEVPGIFNPKEMVCKAIDNIISRLNSIDYDRHVIEFGVFKLTILNETHSIGLLLSYYIYKIEPTIKYVAHRITHPSKRETVIDIHHPAGEELCKKAVDLIKADLNTLRKVFD